MTKPEIRQQQAASNEMAGGRGMIDCNGCGRWVEDKESRGIFGTCLKNGIVRYVYDGQNCQSFRFKGE